MKCYDDELVYERHRHRYEFNNEYREAIESAGLQISGTSPDGRLVEMVELPGSSLVLGGTIPSGIHFPSEPSATTFP